MDICTYIKYYYGGYKLHVITVDWSLKSIDRWLDGIIQAWLRVSPSMSGNNWYCLSATLTEKFVFHFTVSNRKYKTSFYFSLYFLAGRDVGDVTEVGSQCGLLMLVVFRSDRPRLYNLTDWASTPGPGLPSTTVKITRLAVSCRGDFIIS